MNVLIRGHAEILDIIIDYLDPLDMPSLEQTCRVLCTRLNKQRWPNRVQYHKEMSITLRSSSWILRKGPIKLLSSGLSRMVEYRSNRGRIRFSLELLCTFPTHTTLVFSAKVIWPGDIGAWSTNGKPHSAKCHSFYGNNQAPWSVHIKNNEFNRVTNYLPLLKHVDKMLDVKNETHEYKNATSNLQCFS